MVGQLSPVSGSASPREVPEPDQNGDPARDGPTCIPTFGKPRYVLLDELPDPRGSDPVDRDRADEVALQHDNLLSEKEVIMRERPALCCRTSAPSPAPVASGGEKPSSAT